VVEALPQDEEAAVLGRRLDDGVASPSFCARAGLYLTMAATHPPVAKALARRILELRPALLYSKTPTADEKALAKQCAKAGV